MATPAQILKNERLRDIEKIRITRALIPTAGAASTSVVYSIDTDVKEGILQGVRISANPGNDFTISTRCEEPGTDFEVTEILRIENIERHYSEMDLNIIYSNDDEPDELTQLYVQVTNHDSGANTGDITIEFLIEAHDDIRADVTGR